MGPQPSAALIPCGGHGIRRVERRDHGRELGAQPRLVQRDKARREMEKKHGKAALKGKDVDHKVPIRSGGTNAASNLRITTPAKNRGWKRDS